MTLPTLFMIFHLLLLSQHSFAVERIINFNTPGVMPFELPSWCGTLQSIFLKGAQGGHSSRAVGGAASSLYVVADDTNRLRRAVQRARYVVVGATGVTPSCAAGKDFAGGGGGFSGLLTQDYEPIFVAAGGGGASESNGCDVNAIQMEGELTSVSTMRSGLCGSSLENAVGFPGGGGMAFAATKSAFNGIGQPTFAGGGVDSPTCQGGGGLGSGGAAGVTDGIDLGGGGGGGGFYGGLGGAAGKPGRAGISFVHTNRYRQSLTFNVIDAKPRNRLDGEFFFECEVAATTTNDEQIVSTIEPTSVMLTVPPNVGTTKVLTTARTNANTIQASTTTERTISIFISKTPQTTSFPLIAVIIPVALVVLVGLFVLLWCALRRRKRRRRDDDDYGGAAIAMSHDPNARSYDIVPEMQRYDTVAPFKTVYDTVPHTYEQPETKFGASARPNDLPVMNTSDAIEMSKQTLKAAF